MKIPGIPRDEQRRLQSLKASGIFGAGQDERFDRLTRIARRIFNVPVALISLVDEDKLRVKSCDGITLAEPLCRSTSFCAHTLLEPEPLIVPDARCDERFSDNPNVTGHPYIRFYAGFPVRLPDGAAAGSLCLIDTQPRNFSDDELVALKDLAAIVADEFARLDAITVDELTGLFNRRGISALVQYSLVASQRRAEPLSLAYIDLDNFKLINEQWGAVQGDQVLEAMTELLKTSFRDTDLISRHGSDEFVVIFPDTSEQGAFIALQHLGEQVKEYNRTSGKPWQLSFSVGIAEYNELLHRTPEELIQSAGDEIYSIELAGRKISV